MRAGRVKRTAQKAKRGCYDGGMAWHAGVPSSRTGVLCSAGGRQGHGGGEMVA